MRSFFSKNLWNPLILRLLNPVYIAEYIFIHCYYVVFNHYCKPYIFPISNKILILGSGPSLDKISKLNLYDYDSIIAINHAIMCEELHAFSKKVYWISGDHGRLAELSTKLKQLQIKQCLYSCAFPYQMKKVVNLCHKNKITIVGTRISFINHIKMFIDRESPPYPKDPRDINQIVTSYFENSKALLPPLGESTLLSTLLLVSKRCSSIDLLGCDLSDGRSSFSPISVAGKSNLASTNVKNRYLILLKALERYTINIVNHSGLKIDKL